MCTTIENPEYLQQQKKNYTEIGSSRLSKAGDKCLLKSYVIIFGAKKPPKFLRPLWKIPAPLSGTGKSDSTGCVSRNGTVVCAASLSISVCVNSKYISFSESGIDGDGDRIGTSGFCKFNFFLKKEIRNIK